MSKRKTPLENSEIMKRLKQELRDFEEKTPMTLAEKCKVREWVHDGNSIYECGLLWYCESGQEMSFLDAMRLEEEIYNEILEKERVEKPRPTL